MSSTSSRWQEALTRKAGTPVVVSMGDMAAWGGYYVSMGADAIVAEPVRAGRERLGIVRPDGSASASDLAAHRWLGAVPGRRAGGLMATVIRTERLTKRYGHVTALDSLDLEIDQGEVFGYLGPNGAGKSTTIDLLLGFLRPTSGGAWIFGLDAWRDAPAIHRRVAYVPSEANLWPSLTGAEALQFLANVHGWVDDAYRAELVERFELVLDKKMRAYSHGNRQKVLLIAAFATRADLLLLDEPTTGLDPLMEQVFRSCVREARDRGQTVLLSSHVLSEVEAVCDRVAMLRAGRIIETGRLDVLRGLAALRVHARLDGPPPDLSGLEGVSNVVVEDRTVECDVAGSMEPLLRVLGEVGVDHMTTREPSLEELFVSHYGEARPARVDGR